jgi:hypothetical protein
MNTSDEIQHITTDIVNDLEEEIVNITDSELDNKVHEPMTHLEYIEKLDIELEKINEYIKKLWETVMEPYLTNYDANSILNDINMDYSVFYNYVLEHSPAIKYLNERYKMANDSGTNSEYFKQKQSESNYITNYFNTMIKQHIDMAKKLKQQIEESNKA